jgi:hypothetical protein
VIKTSLAINVFTSGNTIVLTAQYSYNKLPSDLDDLPKVTLLEDDESTIIGSPGTAVHTALGEYTYKVKSPEGSGSQDYYAEFAGLSSGEPIVGRIKLTSSFAPA